MNKHWKNYCSIIALFLATGRTNAIVIAILATESFFRPTAHRSFENIYWVLMDIFYPEKAKYISVGISQVQIRHWQKSRSFVFPKSRILKLLMFRSPLLNYDICEEFTAKYIGKEKKVRKILLKYTGNTTRYHVVVFTHFLKLSLKICSKQQNLKSKESKIKRVSTSGSEPFNVDNFL